jgi:hypothetical protein
VVTECVSVEIRETTLSPNVLKPVERISALIGVHMQIEFEPQCIDLVKEITEESIRKKKAERF